MLIKFEVENFKNFKEKVVFDLSASSDYNFSNEAIKNLKGNNSYINKGIIYGKNGSGKSNFGLALFDIISHLTNNNTRNEKYDVYMNLDSNKEVANFKYTFLFNDKYLVYEYSKTKFNELVYEKLSIDGEEFIQYDFRENRGSSIVEGAESLELVSENNVNISRVKFILNTAILKDTIENKVLIKFKEFVERMLLFYSTEERGYIGFTTGSEKLSKIILEKSSVKDFQEFLSSLDINYDLIEKEIDGEKGIYCRFENKDINYFNVISTGTSSLTLFYCWSLEMDKMSLVYMDEFDAFYHFELSQKLMKKIIERLPNTQVFLTTHNTNLIENDILRPDCYFQIFKNNIKSFEQLTDKNIKKEHNLQRMYKGGAFVE